MLLKLNVHHVRLQDLAVDAEAVAAFEQRWRAHLQGMAAYVDDRHNLLDADTVQPLSPLVPTDVYLSHATGDPTQVLQLAVALEATGLRVCVGASLWRQAEALLQTMQRPRGADAAFLDTPYAEQGRLVRASASVWAIVAAVQQRLIDACELFIHLEQPPVRLGEAVRDSRCGGSTWALSERLFARHAARRGRPRLRLEALRPPAAEGTAPLLAAQEAHAIPWDGLLRAIADTTGLPAAPGWRDYPVFLDHLYGKLPLSAQEKTLLGW
ncbi:hypothetical protein [Stenotrophomonas sp.]|uniref:hypothetical protein n=1 Tax=Stenotrophomonas sp. TaxID=69392 RepID=UPI002FC60A8C